MEHLGNNWYAIPVSVPFHGWSSRLNIFNENMCKATAANPNPENLLDPFDSRDGLSCNHPFCDA